MRLPALFLAIAFAILPVDTAPGRGGDGMAPPVLVRVHRAVMAEAVYVPDPPGMDVWQASTVGDCEDIALAMRERLIAAGIAPGSMRIVVFWHHGQRNWHAALLVRLRGQSWVLDSLERAPGPWDGTGNEWEIGPRGRRLVAIDGRPVMTAWRD